MGKKSAEIYFNSQLAGILEKDNETYIFRYTDEYIVNDNCPAISLTLPKQKEPHASQFLFPFFYGLLAEGDNKDMQCRLLKIDENDHFTRLLKTAGKNTIGAVTVKEI
jgi:serine/threonine-protein kinase HipA